jgi:hypothetical protein
MLLEQAFPRSKKRFEDGRYLPPTGTISADFDQLKADGCIQAETDSLRDLFSMLMSMSGRNPCDGCPVWGRKGPGCIAFQNHHSAYISWKKAHDEEIRANGTPKNAPDDHKFAGMNMKQIAAELGISLGEARRRKMEGTLFT